MFAGGVVGCWSFQKPNTYFAFQTPNTYFAMNTTEFCHLNSHLLSSEMFHTVAFARICSSSSFMKALIRFMFHIPLFHHPDSAVFCFVYWQ